MKLLINFSHRNIVNYKKFWFVKNISRWKKEIQQLFLFFTYKNPSKHSSDKVVFINISNINNYSRYFYLLVKFFQIEGYCVYVPKKYKIFRQINSENIFIKLLLKEKIISFKNIHNKSNKIELNDKNLSPNYFDFLNEFNSNFKKNNYYIPIVLFPLLYHKNVWSGNLKYLKRKNSIFAIGNFNVNLYNDIHKSPFNILSRIDLFEHLKKNKLIFTINSENSLEEFIKSSLDSKCILIDSRDFYIKNESIRFVLNRFNFFLACPGMVMPFAHNIAEAMSCGTIPIIQKKYADMFHPPLENHINSIQFDDENMLNDVIQNAYKLPTATVEKLIRNVLNYYNNNMTPHAIITNIKENISGKIYLLAGHYSVKLFNESIK